MVDDVHFPFVRKDIDTRNQLYLNICIGTKATQLPAHFCIVACAKQGKTIE